MQEQQRKTPVLFIIFNRPEATARVFEAIRQAKPERLFIAADGPRQNRPADAELCQRARDVVRSIDWPCQVMTRFQDKNLGCKIHVSSAITWFFERVETGIILEDDCLPNQSFFRFCSEMLERYAHDSQIMAVNGTNFLETGKRGVTGSTYRFSRLVHVWGWASWRRAWKSYDIDMGQIDRLESSLEFSDLFSRKSHLKYWIRHFRHIKEKVVDTWDAQWQYSIFINKGIVISPNVNVVENIGFGKDATHTTGEDPYMLANQMMEETIKGPSIVSVDMPSDETVMQKVFHHSLYKRVLDKITSYFN